MEHNFNPNWPAPADVMMELGRLTAIWASLESGLLVAISRLAGYTETLDGRAVVLSANLGAKQRIDAVGALCLLLVDEFPELSTYPGVVKQLDSARKARNSFAHSAVFLNQEIGRLESAKVTAYGDLKTAVTKVEVKDIREASAKVHVALCGLYSLVFNEEIKPIWARES